MSYVLFDIGGTKTRVSKSVDLRTFCEPITFQTPGSFSEGIQQIAEAANELCEGEVERVAGGIRGILNHDKTMMIHDPGGTLAGWEEKPLCAELKKKLKAPVDLQNDTATVGLGEAHYGAGQGEEIVVYHTVSTGVGGVRIVSGVISPADYGFEPGHQVLDVDRTVLGENEMPTLENLVSGSAVEARMGVKAYEIPQTDAIWDQLATYLAQGLRNTILYWSPDVIVLGGSMIVGDPNIPLNSIIRETEIALDEIVPTPAIVTAELEDFGGLYGAMAMLNQSM